MLGYILLFTFLGSILSLIGGIILLFKEKLTLKISHLLISFAAGTLLGTAFFDLLPEASEESGETNIFLWTLIGILFFFLLERFIHWFHYHNENLGGKNIEPAVPLIILGDSVHNFIDGVVIAATFLVSIPLGIITTLAVAAHEIPQEMGDFAILLHKGIDRKKVLLFNILSALTAFFGAILMFFLKDLITGILPAILSLTAGFFIYIASSDLIPEIHHEKRKWFALYEIILLLGGVLTVWVLVSVLE
ncbi:MAG: ZIP family metal transporter [Candidatus Levybacteria bacterium]|nr:ZIP family metal transporter [Candidatus Levybacteria bacterium]